MRYAGIHPSLPIICVAFLSDNELESHAMDTHRLRAMKGRRLHKEVEGEAMFFEARDRTTLQHSLANAGVDIRPRDRFEADTAISDKAWAALIRDISLTQVLPSSLVITEAGQLYLINEHMSPWSGPRDAFECWLKLPAKHMEGALVSANAAVEPVLCVSTAHIPKEMADQLDNDEHLPGFTTVFRGEYGWVLHISEDDEGVPESLRAITETAKRLGAPYLRFDADASQLEGLPTYHWD
jgi:hypothetical protein